VFNGLMGPIDHRSGQFSIYTLLEKISHGEFDKKKIWRNL